MANSTWTINVVTQTLADGPQLAEPILFPELLCCGSGSSLRTTIRNAIRHLVDASSLHALHRRRLGDAASLRKAVITLEPPSRSAAWREPVGLEFHTVSWRHGEHAHIALVPALGIEVVAATEADLDRMLPEHIVFALRRTKAAQSFYRLALLQRAVDTTIEPIEFPFAPRTPRQVAMDQQREKADKPVIAQVGVILGEQPLAPAWEMEEVVTRLARGLVGPAASSILLVGPSGVGKTAAVRELVRRTRASGTIGNIFWSTSGARLVAGMSGFGMWQQRCLQLCREAARDHAILHLENLVELMEVGRGGMSGAGIADFLRPWLARGEFLAIAECTPEQLALVEQRNPQLLDVFQQIRVEEPSVERGRMILLAQALAVADEKAFSQATIETIDRLHRRYATASAYPGRPLRFLDNLLKDRPQSQTITPATATAAFARETGLPLFMLDPDIPLDLAEATRFFATRVIGQDHAVGLVGDLLATVKTALNRPRRPIASLLFIGPTGVGKTEMAKSLAEFFFSSRDRISRFDMSEFASPDAVERLVGTGYESEGLLTAKVREQPFSVILFDEFEKAHPAFFDLLLQVLGEARLTDAGGRLADFSNCIVVMTSNLGAESYQRGPFGLSARSGATDPAGHFVDEVRSHLRPELFNRIDRVVPFLPLPEDVVMQIAHRELALVGARDGIRQRRTELNIATEAVRQVARIGFDVRYGARPLKRAIEREMLVPLADAINGYPRDLRLTARIDAAESGFSVKVQPIVEDRARVQKTADLMTAANDCIGLRRELQALLRSSAVMAMRNEIVALEPRRKKARSASDAANRERLARLKQVAADLDALAPRITSLEDELTEGVLDAESTARPAANILPELQEQWQTILLDLYALRFERPHAAVFAIYSESASVMQRLATAYFNIARSWSAAVRLAWYKPHGRDQLERRYADDPAKFLADPDSGCVGIALAIDGRHIMPRLANEGGLHVFISGKNSEPARVEVSDHPVEAYRPPAWAQRRGALPGGERRREWDFDRAVVSDAQIQSTAPLDTSSIEPALADILAFDLRQRLQEVISQ